MNYPPKYRYLLPDDIDREMFEYIKNEGKNKDHFKLDGSEEDKNKFLILLIRTQKSLHDWRAIWIDILNEVKKNNIVDVRSLINKYPEDSIGDDVPDWVTYEGDRIVNDFIDELKTRKISFIGSEKEMIEFILRFWLAQLGSCWESSIMMIWEMLGDDSEISLLELNNELKGFDPLGIFNNLYSL